MDTRLLTVMTLCDRSLITVPAEITARAFYSRKMGCLDYRCSQTAVKKTLKSWEQLGRTKSNLLCTQSHKEADSTQTFNNFSLKLPLVSKESEKCCRLVILCTTIFVVFMPATSSVFLRACFSFIVALPCILFNLLHIFPVACTSSFKFG